MRPLALCAAVAAAPETAWADDPPDDEGVVIRITRDEVHIRAPGVRIDVDGKNGSAVVDIDTGDTRVYADETGRVDIRAPGVSIQADPDPN